MGKKEKYYTAYATEIARRRTLTREEIDKVPWLSSTYSETQGEKAISIITVLFKRILGIG